MQRFLKRGKTNRVGINLDSSYSNRVGPYLLQWPPSDRRLLWWAGTARHSFIQRPPSDRPLLWWAGTARRDPFLQELPPILLSFGGRATTIFARSGRAAYSRPSRSTINRTRDPSRPWHEQEWSIFRFLKTIHYEISVWPWTHTTCERKKHYHQLETRTEFSEQTIRWVDTDIQWKWNLTWIQWTSIQWTNINSIQKKITETVPRYITSNNSKIN